MNSSNGSDSRNSSNEATAAETMAVTAGSESGYKNGSDSCDRVAVAGGMSATDTVAIEAKQRQLQHQRRWR